MKSAPSAATLEVIPLAWRTERKSSSPKTVMTILERLFVPSCAQTAMRGIMDYEELSRHNAPKGTNKARVVEPKEIEI